MPVQSIRCIHFKFYKKMEVRNMQAMQYLENLKMHRLFSPPTLLQIKPFIFIIMNYPVK